MWGKGEERVRREKGPRGGKEFNERIQNTTSTFPIPIYLIHPIRVFRTVIRYNKGPERDFPLVNHLKSSLSLVAITLFVAFPFSFEKKNWITKVLVSLKFDCKRSNYEFLIEWNCYWDFTPFRNLFRNRFDFFFSLRN